jgi:hypothetical protein
LEGSKEWDWVRYLLGAYKDPKSYIALLKMPELFIELYRRANTVFEVVRAVKGKKET